MKIHSKIHAGRCLALINGIRWPLSGAAVLASFSCKRENGSEEARKVWAEVANHS